MSPEPPAAPPRTDLEADPSRPATDPRVALGTIAYGVFALARPGALREVAALQDRRSGPPPVPSPPADAHSTTDADGVHPGALLDQLGELDI